MALLQQPQQPQQVPAAPTQQTADAESEKLKQHVGNIVHAAHLFMYGNATRDKYMTELKTISKGRTPPQIASKMAETIMLILMQQSNFKMHPKAVIPAGIMIAGEILDFLAESSGGEANEKMANETIMLFVKEIQDTIAKVVGQPAVQGA